MRRPVWERIPKAIARNFSDSSRQRSNCRGNNPPARRLAVTMQSTSSREGRKGRKESDQRKLICLQREAHCLVKAFQILSLENPLRTWRTWRETAFFNRVVPI